MKKKIILYRSKFLKLLMLGTVLVIFSGLVNVSAENYNLVDQRTTDFKVGDKVEVSVSGMEEDQYYQPCVILEVHNNGYTVRCIRGNVEYFVRSSWVRAVKKAQPAKQTEEDEDTSTNEQIFNALDRNEDGWLSGKELIACQCKGFDKNGNNEITKGEFLAGMNKKEDAEADGDDETPTPQKDQKPVNEPKPRQTKETPPDKNEAHSGPLTETIVKQVVTRIQERAITGVSWKPDSLTIDFEIISFGTTRKANLQDEFGGIPKGETVYPVRVKHTIHNHFKNGSKEDLEEDWIFEFFKNKFGEWEGYYAGDAK